MSKTRIVFGAFVIAFSGAMSAPDHGLRAQDIRGLEVCTAERDLGRRTSCLQANVEFLQQELGKLRRSAQKAVEDERAAAAKEVAALRSDLAALKIALEKTQTEMAELKKPKPAADKDKK